MNRLIKIGDLIKTSKTVYCLEKQYFLNVCKNNKTIRPENYLSICSGSLGLILSTNDFFYEVIWLNNCSVSTSLFIFSATIKECVEILT